MRKFILFTFFIIFINTLFFCLQGYSATYYMDPNTGNDGNAGTKEAPWKTLAAKVNTLTAGDILFLRGGIYYERFTITVAGTQSKPIRIVGYPGEFPIIDGGNECKALRATPNTLWTMYGTSTNTYVTTGTYASGIGARGYGYLGPENGGYQLNSYDKLTDLVAESENATMDETVGTYCGPGIYYDSAADKFYCRLEKTAIQTELLDVEYPTSNDPSQTALYLFGSNDAIKFGATAAYIDLEGVSLKHSLNVLDFTAGADHINVRNCYIRGGRTPVYVNDDVSYLLFENCKFESSIPPWISWTDVKSGRNDGSQIAANYQGAAIDIQGDSHHIEVAYCVFDGVFDGINPIDNAYNISVHHNVFTGIRDDCMQIGTACYNVEVNHNKMTNVSKSCSTNASSSGTNALDANLGKVWIHHNIIDCTPKKLGGRAKNNSGLGNGLDTDYDTFDSQYAGINNDGLVYARPFGDHSTNEEIAKVPWKIYNNTIKFGRDLSNHGSGAEYRFEVPTTPVYHEVYNNIMWQTEDFRYLRDIQVDSSVSNSIYDGNCYYCSSVGTVYASQRFQVKDVSVETDYASLAAFKASDDFTETQVYYTPGWEASGIEGDPGLDSQYYPTNNNARIGGIDLSSKGWPGVDGGIYRGALKPK